MMQQGKKVVVDSAFNIGRNNYLIKSSQIDPMYAEALLLNRGATSIWQLSIGGMHMIGGSFPRLKDRLKFEEVSY